MMLQKCPATASRMAYIERKAFRPNNVRVSRFLPFAPARLPPNQPKRHPLTSAAVEEPAATQAPASSATGPAPVYVEVDTEFNIAKVSFGKILTPVGSALLLYGFASYIQLVPGGALSSLLLVYGLVGGLLGFALLYAQLEPVPLKTTAEAYALRASQMTDIQKQVREDCTRFRYGDEQHLEEALDRIFRFNKPNGIARRLAPVLTGLREETRDGRYSLILEFNSKLPLEQWEKRISKIQSFFGPGIIAKLEVSEEFAAMDILPKVDVALINDGSGKGRGGGEQKDVLPPLVPGLPARRQ